MTVSSKSSAIKRVTTHPIIQRAGSALPRVNRRADKVTIANINKAPKEYKVVVKTIPNTPKKTSATSVVSTVTKKTKVNKT